MRYGEPPAVIDVYGVDCKEMLFYQDMLIKLSNEVKIRTEPRLNCFNKIIGAAACDYVALRGLTKFKESYMYISAKNIYQPAGSAYNRPGWHCDGFMTDDINYIWSNRNPTIFNTTHFNLTQDDTKSMEEMREQYQEENNITYPNNTLLRLNQYNVHKVGPQEEGMRTFVKVTFSKDKYNLIGNTHNYEVDYHWEMRERGSVRNTPQILK